MITWPGHLVDIREKRNAYKGLWLRNIKEISQRTKMIILEWISKNGMGGHGLDTSDSEQGQVVGSCEHCNETSGTIKCNEFD